MANIAVRLTALTAKGKQNKRFAGCETVLRLMPQSPLVITSPDAVRIANAALAENKAAVAAKEKEPWLIETLDGGHGKDYSKDVLAPELVSKPAKK